MPPPPAASLEFRFSSSREDFTSPNIFLNNGSLLTEVDFVIPDSGASPLTPGEPGSNRTLTLSNSARLLQEQVTFTSTELNEKDSIYYVLIGQLCGHGDGG